MAYIRQTFDWFLVADNRFLFHIEQDGKVVGYCGGFIPKGIGDGSSSGMLQHAFKQAVRGFLQKPWLLLNAEVRPMYPFLFKNIKRRLFSGGKANRVQPRQPSAVVHAGLVVIGVHPSYRGTGIYHQLMQHFFEEALRKGAVVSKLSVRKDNARGIAAYKKAGWTIAEDHLKTFVLQRVLK
jgi:ribosomal protein S18 acetylase RimI-like enzyme